MSPKPSVFRRLLRSLAACLATFSMASAALAQDKPDEPQSEALRGDYRGDRWGQPGIELFNGPNFSGDRRFFPGEESNLTRSGFNDQAVSVRVRGRGAWQLCDDAGFRGRCVFVDRDDPDLNRLGIAWRVSSIRPVDDGGGHGGGYGGGWGGGGGPEIVLYERDGYGGRSIRLRDGVSNLTAQGFNDAARSIRTRGRWVVCEHSGYEGRCRTIEGDLWDLNGIGLANRISSLRPADGWGGGGYDPGYPGGGSIDHGGGVQGRSTVFFPNPSFSGQPAQACYGGGGRDCQRRAADDFCRRAGLRESVYFSVERGRRGDVLTDLLCAR